MNNVDLIGHLGSVLTSITFIPQVYRTWKTKQVEGLSLTMMGIVLASTVVWLAYGLMANLLPVIICNSIVFTLSLILIILKLKYGRKAHGGNL